MNATKTYGDMVNIKQMTDNIAPVEFDDIVNNLVENREQGKRNALRLDHWYLYRYQLSTSAALYDD
jgi:hypothetical protein